MTTVSLDLREFLQPSEADPPGIWISSLQADGKSPRTIRSYNETGVQLLDFLTAHKMPTEVSKIEKKHISAYITDVLSDRSTSTAGLRYRSLSVLFNYMVTDGWIDDSPMRTMSHPKQETKVVPVVGPEALTKLLKACEGTDFLDRRDFALISFMIDTGVRVGEVVGMNTDDIHFASKSVLIRGKGSRERTVAMGPKAFSAMNKYRALRNHQNQAEHTDHWWFSVRGPLTTSGVTQILRRRCDDAGIERIRPHQLRHTFAHVWLATGGNEGDLMHQAGWSSRTMLDRYGASAASERARAAHDKHSPLEQL